MTTITTISKSIATGLLLCLISTTPWAKDGRDFAGFYSLNNVVENEDTVRLSLHLRFYNYSGDAITDALVELNDHFLPGQSYGELGTVDLAERAEARLNGDFEIPKPEYEAWRQGLMPRITVSYTDAYGDTIERLVEVIWMPLLDRGMQP